MMNHNQDAAPPPGPVPAFSDISHPALPDWVLAALDRMFAMEPRITKVHFDLWAHSYHDDNANMELKGSVTINGSGGLTEDDLDEVPPVRLLERRADAMWYYVPLSVDDSETATVNGDYDFYAERGHIAFEYRTMGELEHVMGFDIRHDGGEWRIAETIVIGGHEGSASDLLAADAARVIAVYSEGELMLDEMPETIGVEMDADENVVFHLKPGELTRCMEKR